MAWQSGLKEFILPSWERLLLFILIVAAANMPFIGTYHTEKTSYYCLQTKDSQCQTAGEREMHLNPFFWLPFIYGGGYESLGRTQGGGDDMRIPALELLKNPLPIPLILTVIYWYLAACIMVSPFSGDKKPGKYYD